MNLTEKSRNKHTIKAKTSARWWLNSFDLNFFHKMRFELVFVCGLPPLLFCTQTRWPFFIQTVLKCVVFVCRIPFPKRPSSPQSQPSLGWSSLRTSSTGTLRLLSWQTGSNTGFCQSRELLRPSLCSRGSGCLGWRHHGEQFHSVCHTGW